MFFVYKKILYTFFIFRTFASTMTPSCFNLQLREISGIIFSYSKRFTDEFILYIYLVLIYFNPNICFIFLLFNICYIFLKCFFLAYCVLKIQVNFNIFQFPCFLAKKSSKPYFNKHIQKHIDLSHRLTLLVKH